MAKAKETVEKVETVAIPETTSNSECECVEMDTSQFVGSAVSSNFNYGLEETFLMEDMEDRKLFIRDTITSEVYDYISYNIMRYNAMDMGVPIEERQPIKLYIATGGGCTFDGLGICEILKASLTPVIGICTSYAFSMGFYIYISCDLRYATANAMFLNHEGEDGILGHPSKIKDYIRFADKLEDRLNKIIVKRTKLTMRDLNETERVEDYYFADEAKDIGVVDYIIGEDCTIDDIL